MYNFGFKFNHGKNTFLGHYLPISPKDTLTLGYITRPSKHLNMFAELRASPQGFSESTMGFKLRFNSGTLTGSLNSQWKASSVVSIMMDSMIMTSVNASVNFAKPEDPATFGIALSLGGGG